MSVSLHQGDCLVTLRGMADNSVDSIVTDPPYGLSFMGKKWDYDVPSVEIWAECLRVLKPGGHLLAFAGTRTQHRMAVRIEDAGFEIRDMIMWTYASGFPKSHNLDNLRGDKICGCAEPYTQNGAKQKTQCNLRPVRDADVSAPESIGEKRGEVLQQGLQEQGASIAGRPQLSAAEDGCGQSCMEGRRDPSQAPGQLCAGKVHQSARVGGTDGAQGRVCDGAPAGDGGVVRLPADADGGSSPRGPQPAAQRSQESGAVAGQSEPQVVGAWPVCGGCGLPMVPRGLGTALKPALEPITMARKPLIGTVASNVLAHGTGGLNIDGCRVGDELVEKGRAGRSECESESLGKKLMGTESQQWQHGRWPANLIHDGSAEVVAGFPVTGAAKSGVRDPNGSMGYHGGASGLPGVVSGHDDNGGSAARFFYAAKASKKDRDEGLAGFEVKAIGSLNMRSDAHAERTGALPKPRANTHPTVKPTELMAYLCRLVTPPGGVVLDPFMGSGSTGKAALREGFGFIGCEMSPEYMAIASARIEAALAELYV